MGAGTAVAATRLAGPIAGKHTIHSRQNMTNHRPATHRHRPSKTKHGINQPKDLNALNKRPVRQARMNPGHQRLIRYSRKRKSRHSNIRKTEQPHMIFFTKICNLPPTKRAGSIIKKLNSGYSSIGHRAPHKRVQRQHDQTPALATYYYTRITQGRRC